MLTPFINFPSSLKHAAFHPIAVIRGWLSGNGTRKSQKQHQEDIRARLSKLWMACEGNDDEEEAFTEALLEQLRKSPRLKEIFPRCRDLLEKYREEITQK